MDNLQLLAGLAHEIRNPLSTIKVNLGLLHEDLQTIQPDVPDGVHRFADVFARVGRLKSETERLQRILDDFLNLTGRLELHRTPLDLNVIVQETLDFFRPTAQAAGVRLEALLTSRPLPLSGDRAKLRQSLFNLLLNALDAVRPGSHPFPSNASPSTPTIAITTAIPENICQLIVSDTGPGISPEHLPHIFEAFYSTKKHGSGLGLAITKRIIEAHGGTITVDNTPLGAKFIVTLPAV